MRTPGIGLESFQCILHVAVLQGSVALLADHDLLLTGFSLVHDLDTGPFAKWAIPSASVGLIENTCTSM